MKPTKNKIFCYGAKRTKMLFETQAKADNFIKYNSAEMLETVKKAPVRSYYCQFCMGWHVTSNPNVTVGAELDQKEKAVLETLSEHMKLKKVKKAKIEVSFSLLQEAENKAMQFNLQDARDLLISCESDYKEAMRLKNTKYIDRYNQIVHLLSELNRMEEDAEYEPDVADNYVFIVSNFKVKTDLEKRLLNLRELAEKGDAGFREEIQAYTNLLSKLSGTCHSKIRKVYNGKLQAVVRVYEENCPENQSEGEKKATGKKPKVFVRKDLYRKNLLDVIDKIGSLETYYGDGEIRKCEHTIDLCEILLDELQYEDESTTMLRRHLAQWVERLREADVA